MAVVTTSSTSSFPFASILTLLFIGLKLGGAIGWSWWWVLSPLWISALGVIAVVLFAILVAVLVAWLR